MAQIFESEFIKRIQLGVLVAYLPKSYRDEIEQAISSRLEREREMLEAQAMGLTVERYRAYKSNPTIFDWGHYEQ